MAVNLADIDDKLLEEAKSLGNYPTEKEAINAALEEYIHRKKQMKLFEIAGTIDYYEDDPKITKLENFLVDKK